LPKKTLKEKKHYTLHPRKVGDKLESATRVVQVAHKPPARHATLGAASKLLHGIGNGGRGTSIAPLAIHFYKSGQEGDIHCTQICLPVSGVITQHDHPQWVMDATDACKAHRAAVKWPITCCNICT